MGHADDVLLLDTDSDSMCLHVCALICVLRLSTVNLLDSRSVMGDLGWVAYPKNGVSLLQT